MTDKPLSTISTKDGPSDPLAVRLQKAADDHCGGGIPHDLGLRLVSIIEAQHAADLEAVREALPDEIDLYRLIKKAGARSNRGAAHVIAKHLAALDLSQITGTTPYVPKADLDAAQEEITRLREALHKSANQHRVIAGMDMIGASSVAYNAARDAEAALAKTGGK